MKAKLIPPHMDKNWSLQFLEVSTEPGIRLYIWATCREIGDEFSVRPFLQGDFEDWMMCEFWTTDEDNILSASEKICEHLKLELTI